MIQNAQNVGLVDTAFDELVTEKYFTEACDFLRIHAIRHAQQSKEKAARQILGTNQSPNSSKRDKAKKGLAFINKLQVQNSAIQDSTNSDEELDALTPTKAATV